MDNFKFELTEDQVYKIYRNLYDLIGKQYGVQIDFTLEKKDKED